MPTQSPSKPIGVKQPQSTGQQTEKQGQRLPSIRVDINWLNQKDDGNIRATASMTIGGAFTVHGIKVISGQKGDFVSMPSYKSGDSYKDIFHAVTAAAREQMNDAVMTAYEQKLADQERGEAFTDSEPSQNTGMQGMNQ